MKIWFKRYDGNDILVFHIAMRRVDLVNIVISALGTVSFGLMIMIVIFMKCT